MALKDELPNELRVTLKGLLNDRSTIYGYHPRLAGVRVKDDERGGFTVEADARLVATGRRRSCDGPHRSKASLEFCSMYTGASESSDSASLCESAHDFADVPLAASTRRTTPSARVRSIGGWSVQAMSRRLAHEAFAH